MDAANVARGPSQRKSVTVSDITMTCRLSDNRARLGVEEVEASPVHEELNPVTNVGQLACLRAGGELVRTGAHVHERFATQRLNEVDDCIHRGVIGRRRALDRQA